MKTTALIAEHIIIGFQTILWGILFLNWQLGLGGLLLEKINSCEGGFHPILLIGLILFVYPLGIIMDNMADYALKGFESSIKSVYLKDQNMSVRFLTAMLKDESLTHHFDYMRTRIRICRSTGFNFIFITITLCMNSLSFDGYSIRVIGTFLFTGLLIVSASFFSWYLLTKSYIQSIQRNYKLVVPENGSPAAQPQV